MSWVVQDAACEFLQIAFIFQVFILSFLYTNPQDSFPAMLHGVRSPSETDFITDFNLMT